MCGRFVTPDEAALEREFNLTPSQAEAQFRQFLTQNFNAAPTQQVPVIRVIRDRDGRRSLETMRWGLIPFWAKGEPPKYSTINATVEKLETAPTWRGPWRRSQRCIFPAAGFYEWHVLADGSKQPYFVHPAGDGELFAIAGLWDSSTTEGGQTILSCTILTMPANELMAGIHNAKQRMPLILHKEDVDTWLTGTPEAAGELLVQYPSELMRAHRVSRRVNTPKNNDPELVQPVEDGD